MTVAAPKVTVVMTAFNREKYIEESIESFLSQTCSNRELVICDDCSKDKTFEIARKYADNHPNIIALRNEENKGTVYTINRLFHAAQGEYVCILDSDDGMVPDRIEHQLRLLNQYHADAVTSEYFRGTEMATMQPQQPIYNEVTVLGLETGYIHVPGGSLFFKRKILDIIPGFHDYFADTFCGDLYFINLIAEKFKLLYDPRPVYYYRMTRQSLTQVFNLYKYSKLEIAKRLVLQRKNTGTDDLEQKNYPALERMQQDILSDKKWISTQFQIFASREIDNNNFRTAWTFLVNAFKNRPLYRQNLQALFYFLRRLIIYPIYAIKH